LKAQRHLCPFCPAVPKDVTSRRAFSDGLMQSFKCGYVHKDNRPEHRSICRELTNSHISRLKHSPIHQLCNPLLCLKEHLSCRSSRCQGDYLPAPALGACMFTASLGDTGPLCRPVKHADVC